MNANLPLDHWRELASRRLPRFVFDYLEGGADEERTLLRNRAALDRILLLPRCLRDVSRCDVATTLFDCRAEAPIVIAPTGFNELFWPDGDVVLARSAANAGIPFVMSTASTSRIEDVGDATAGDKWFQLYVMEDRRVAENLMSRARSSGFRVLVLTVDMPVAGNRVRDLRNGMKLPPRLSARTLVDVLSHPRWLLRRFGRRLPSLVNLEADVPHAREAIAKRAMDRTLNWQSIKWLRSCWDGPIVLKGILHPDDAAKAHRCGVDGIVVSNHGGRQLDIVPASIDLLPRVLDKAGSKAAVFIDSGFRSGGDVVRALALGARAVFIGRPVLHGLAACGMRGASLVIETLRMEIQRTLTLAGVSAIDQLEHTQVRYQDELRATLRPGLCRMQIRKSLTTQHSSPSVVSGDALL